MQHCPLCISTERKTYEELLLTGEVSKTTVATELETNISVITTHMESHINSSVPLSPEEGEPGKSAKIRDLDSFKDTLDKRDVIINNIMILQEHIERLSQSPNLSTGEYKNLVAIAGELRKSSTDLATLTGDIKKETVLTINMFNELQGIILSELCPDCREIVLKRISNISGGCI